MISPEIRISFSELLYDFVSREFAKNSGEALPSMDDCYVWTENYRKEWAKFEELILHAMTEALGVEFYRTTIDVSTAPLFIPQSERLIVNFRNAPDQFVDVLTHELAHVLPTDNNKVQIRNEQPKLTLVEE